MQRTDKKLKHILFASVGEFANRKATHAFDSEEKRDAWMDAMESRGNKVRKLNINEAFDTARMCSGYIITEGATELSQDSFGSMALPGFFVFRHKNKLLS